ncbi:hypothetical protein [Sphingomonas sp. TDK1]|uniref:hypothetical protein n=1 Tax=Sphingomonas sp. TDK1 TaxID=453247 RepID=UPI0007DA14F5|nr:hypothetical protein [Sphingomonas sp. TDK1]OAN66248.1 hypothetical protein A7X12_12705 [Sphingomonas sp. TDK1]
MLPSRPAALFRSRWAALLWAAGVVWTAISVAGMGDAAKSPAPVKHATDALGQPIDNADLDALRNALSG